MRKKSLHSTYKLQTSVLALCAATAISAPVLAQDDEEGDILDVIVVTAAAGDRSQIDSAVSSNQVGDEVIQNFQPNSESELFRLLPGIQVAGQNGPGGNANIAVRGLPVATGGAPFVQIQEDGLPTVLFGDIQFGNNDYWTKFDATVKAVEAVRGGTASTFASQAPGAVINYISHTGEQEGGYVQLRKGLGFDETRVDFRYGAPINDSLRFHVGGYFNSGEGPLNIGYNASESFQIKGNSTYEFDDGAGFFRLLVKYADTKEPNWTGAPILGTVNGNNVSDLQAFPGFDGRDDLNNSPLVQEQLVLGFDGDLTPQPINGITTEQFTVGGHFFYEVNDTFTVSNKARWSDISGAFAENFLGIARTDSVIGSDLSLNGVPYATVAEIRYASGLLAGQTYTDTYLDNNAQFQTNIRDLGSFVNDLTITGNFDTDFGAVTARAGYFYMSQDIVIDWHINRNNRSLDGVNSAPLDLFDDMGNQLTQQGISGYNNNWGSCCARDYDLNYTNQAPYFALDLDLDRVIIDGSVRYDTIKATGFTLGSSGNEFFVNSNGIDIPAITIDGPMEVLDYSQDYVSWTAGALFKLDGNTSFFGRAAKGNRFNSDRQTYAGNFNGDGSLTQAGMTSAVDVVKQYEIGVKHRGDLGFGRYTVEVTLLKGKFNQNTFEINALVCEAIFGPGSGGTCIISADFKSQGVEFYGTFNRGGLSIVANATYSDAKRRLGGAPDFEAAPNIPDLTYTLAGNYDFNQYVSAGLTLTGQTKHTGNGNFRWPSTNTVNAVVKFRPFENVEIGVEAFNLFDSYYVRAAGNVLDQSISPALLVGPTSLGRTFRASARYSF